MEHDFSEIADILKGSPTHRTASANAARLPNKWRTLERLLEHTVNQIDLADRDRSGMLTYIGRVRVRLELRRFAIMAALMASAPSAESASD